MWTSDSGCYSQAHSCSGVLYMNGKLKLLIKLFVQAYTHKYILTYSVVVTMTRGLSTPDEI